MRYVFPCARYEEKAKAYIQEFLDHGSAINGVGGLDRALEENNYAGWLQKVLADLDLANVPADRVPAITYFYVCEEEDEIVGMINVRLALNDFLRSEGGHIGYSVRPARRRQGHATQMLRGALGFCRRLGLAEVIVSCDKANPASAGVIRNCGGVLDAEFYSQAFGGVIQRYRIDTAEG